MFVAKKNSSVEIEVFVSFLTRDEQTCRNAQTKTAGSILTQVTVKQPLNSWAESESVANKSCESVASGSSSVCVHVLLNTSRQSHFQ